MHGVINMISYLTNRQKLSFWRLRRNPINREHFFHNGKWTRRDLNPESPPVSDVRRRPSGSLILTRARAAQFSAFFKVPDYATGPYVFFIKIKKEVIQP